MYTPFKDDIYAYALSKTLTKVPSPVTIGLYSSCQDRINMILEKLEVYMKQEASEIERKYTKRPKPRSAAPSATGFLALIGRLLLYNPIWTKENQDHHNVRFIYVHFSAWHFAGSDMLWAGLVLRLCQAMQLNFGKLQMVLYRVGQYDEEDEVKEKIVENGPNHWRPKKICCCPLWVFLLCLLVIPVVILVLYLKFNFFKPEVIADEGVNGTTGEVDVVEGMFIAILGVPAVSALRFIFLMCKNLIFSQEMSIKKGMDNQRISSQLGFMNEVRKEMWFLSRFIQFMEVFEGRRIRLVLKITNLDRCSPRKIVGVLDAVNILLSDEESPFISILAANPEVLIEKVNYADGCFSKEDKAYAMLNRIVTLAFTVPPLCDDSKLRLFCSLTRNSKSPKVINIWKEENVSSVEIPLGTEESYPLMDNSTVASRINEEELEKLVKNILTSNERKLNTYMLDDVMSMRRVINSIRVTVIIMKALKKEVPQPENIAPWVVLANLWPCRLSWIIQCVEDAQQRADIDCGRETDSDDSKTLWEVFSESRAELYVMSSQIEVLLEHDEDPEMFERFLKVDFQFTIKDLMTYEVATVNLDSTIQRELAHIRGTSRLKDSGWIRNLAPLPITTIIKMNTEDVCKEMKKMEYSSKYIDIVKSNDLDGSALVFGDADDIKKLLGMNLGEWATFKLHFLGVPSHLRPQQKKKQPTPSSSHSHLHIPSQHVSCHFLSTPNLVDSSA